MKKIAIISGPALGHVGRLYKAALAINKIIMAEVHFIYPEHSNYINKLVAGDFKTFAISINKDCRFPENTAIFARGVEKHLSEIHYDLIIQDANPLLWTSLIAFPNIPRVNITNAFLTKLRPEPTAQENTFNKFSKILNKLRIDKDLDPLDNVYQLYEADLVLLADPKPIVNLLGTIPEHYIQCGSCSWSYEGTLPKELIDKNDILLFSMGSTGKTDLNHQFLKIIKEKLGNHTSVYAGSKVDDIKQKHNFDFLYQWLPLEETLCRSKAVITQGGAGSSYQALEKKCPVFMFPTHQNHKILGNLITDLGIGFCIDAETTIDQLQAINIEKMSQNTIKYAESISKEEGSIRIANEISRLL